MVHLFGFSQFTYYIHGIINQIVFGYFDLYFVVLLIALTSLKYAGVRSFQKAAPILYNALPVTIKTAPSLAVFDKRLKTYLFTKANMV